MKSSKLVNLTQKKKISHSKGCFPEQFKPLVVNVYLKGIKLQKHIVGSRNECFNKIKAKERQIYLEGEDKKFTYFYLKSS